MFEELEHKRSPEEKKLLLVEAVVASVVVVVVGVGLVWFFGLYAG